MRQKDNLKVAAFITMIIILIVCIFVSKWMYESIMASNLPDWLKWMLLH